MIEAEFRSLEERQALIQKIDDMGGVIRAIEAGYIQREIGDSAYTYQKEVESGDQVVVGVNKFQIQEKAPTDLLRVDPAMEAFQRGKTQKVKAERDADAVKSTLAAVHQVATDGGNVMPAIVDAVKVYASLGEICDELRDVYGEYTEGG